MEWMGRRSAVLRTVASAVLTVFAAGCTDKPELPTTAAATLPGRIPVVGSASKAGASGEKTRGGKVKRYRVKVDHKRKVIDAETELVTQSTVGLPENCLEPGGCPPEEASYIYSGEFDVSGETRDSTNTGQPWDPAYAGMGEEGTRFHCKQAIDDIRFTHLQYAFTANGYATYIGPAANRSWGVVRGRYQLPGGPHLSSDGKAEVLSGVVEGNCYFEWRQVGPLLFEYGIFVATKFIGQWREVPEDVPGGGTIGGDWQGAGSEATAVFLNFLNYGECTPGWVIVVDGVRVC